MDIEKSLLPTSKTYSGAILSDAKIPQMFESTSIENEHSNREVTEAERQIMVARVEKLAKKLHLDNVEIVTDASTLEGDKQRAKGFYSMSTGKITIVIPNHSSAFDVEQTLLHEAVAHYGLRQLFGKHFDTFLDNVFNNAYKSIRRKIVDLSAKNGWDFRKATEEYLAGLADNTQFEEAYRTGWCQQIKDFLLNLLHKIGFEDFRGVTLTDNELRYILWRSYENLVDPCAYRNVFGEAADIVCILTILTPILMMLTPSKRAWLSKSSPCLLANRQ